MNVQIQSVKFDADKRLIEFVETKMAKLDRFADRSTGAEVILKLDKDHEKGNKIATITLHMPGEDLVACHQSKAFEESVDEAIDALKRQLDKFKGNSACKQDDQGRAYVDFTALPTLCDCSAKTAICALAAAGYQTPDDISVIGTEGLNASQYFLPPLTCVGVDLAHYMDTILDAVEELIRNPEQQIQLIEPQKIFVRSSVKTISPQKENAYEK